VIDLRGVEGSDKAERSENEEKFVCNTAEFGDSRVISKLYYMLLAPSIATYF
jgi:hypothetical protein